MSFSRVGLGLVPGFTRDSLPLCSRITRHRRGHDYFRTTAVCRCCRSPVRGDLHLHAHPGLGRGWPNLVRRRTAHPSIRYRGARDRRQLPSKSSLPEGICRAGTRRAGSTHRASGRCLPRRPHTGKRTSSALSVRRQCRRIANRGMVRITDNRRSVLRDGQGRVGTTVGPVLAAAPVRAELTVIATLQTQNRKSGKVRPASA